MKHKKQLRYIRNYVSNIYAGVYIPRNRHHLLGITVSLREKVLYITVEHDRQ